jgi:hypothetical protein
MRLKSEMERQKNTHAIMRKGTFAEEIDKMTRHTKRGRKQSQRKNKSERF